MKSTLVVGLVVVFAILEGTMAKFILRDGNVTENSSCWGGSTGESGYTLDNLEMSGCGLQNCIARENSCTITMQFDLTSSVPVPGGTKQIKFAAKYFGLPVWTYSEDVTKPFEANVPQHFSATEDLPQVTPPGRYDLTLSLNEIQGGATIFEYTGSYTKQ